MVRGKWVLVLILNIILPEYISFIIKILIYLFLKYWILYVLESRHGNKS